MDVWGFEHIQPWLEAREKMPVGPLFCVLDGRTRGRAWSAGAAPEALYLRAARAGVRRRFAPHQLLDRVLAYGDHWMPNVVGGDDVLLERIQGLRSRAARAGRDIGVTVNAAASRPARLERYLQAGVDRCVFSVPSAGADEVEAKLARVLESAASLGLQP